MSFLCRLATENDRAVLGDLRWRLQCEDAKDDAGRIAFAAEFARNTLHNEDLFHFIVEEGGSAIGAMSVRKVWKVPAPGRDEAAWGYLTNCYVLPECRNAGAGQAILEFITDWARSERLELLVVWPSEPAYSFYERAGFARPSDPLVLNLD